MTRAVRKVIHKPAEHVEKILLWISEGKTLRDYCRQENSPSFQLVYLWLDKDPDFAGRFARAREIGADAIAAEALEIADTPIIGEETEDDGDKLKVKRGDMLGHRKLQVETRLKLLAKWFPQKYGDHSSLELTGAGGGPVQFSDTERAARIAAILAGAKKRAKAAKSRKGGNGSGDV